jgi:glycine rich protein
MVWGVLLSSRLPKAAGALLALGCLAAAAPTSALAATQVFGYTGGEQTYVVGPDVHSLHVVAVGAPGGEGSDDPPNQLGGLGGFGARLEGNLAVTPGQVLFVEVGGPGAEGGHIAGGGKGGFNGGGSSNNGGFNLPGGGGGGATDIRSCSTAAVCVSVANTLASRLLVAAGGGGGGTIGRLESPSGGEGGDGGEAGATGQPLNCSTGTTPGAGGGAGTQVGGGAGGAGGMNGAPAGLPGMLAQGGGAGSGGSNSEPGGGGGGGYYGGGAGGSGNGCAAGGGGGGSSFVNSAVTDLLLSIDQAGVPSVTITPITPAASTPPPQQTVTAKPPNGIKFEQLRKFKRRGTALLTLELPGPGTLLLSGKGLLLPKGFSPAGTKALSARGEVGLLIKVKGKRKRKLDRIGRVKVRAAVTFTPTGGDPSTFERRITLVKIAAG